MNQLNQVKCFMQDLVTFTFDKKAKDAAIANTHQKLYNMGFESYISFEVACKYPNNFNKAIDHIRTHNDRQNKIENEEQKTYEKQTLTLNSLHPQVIIDRKNKMKNKEHKSDQTYDKRILQCNVIKLSHSESKYNEDTSSNILKNMRGDDNIVPEIEQKRLENMEASAVLMLDELIIKFEINNLFRQSTVRITSPSTSVSTFEDNYKILNKIGSPGTFGIAYKIKHKSDGKILAVKEISKKDIYTLKPSNETRQSLLEHMRSEIDVMRRLNHKYIIKMYEKYETKYKLRIVMELCKGGSLLNRIQNNGRHKEIDCKLIIKQICEALFYMHDKHKILHSDLKPDNILFVDNTKTSNIKIIDFGLSKHLPRLQGSLSEVCGTPYYMAPEVINGEYSHECDMWSVGVITFYMIFGLHPFYVDPKKDNHVQKIIKLISQGFNPITKPSYGPWFPKSLVSLISKNGMDFIANLLETNIAKRFTANEALRDPWLNFNIDYYYDKECLKKLNDSLKLNDLIAILFANFCISHKFKYVISGLFHEHYKNMRPKHYKHLKQLFSELDKDGNGKIKYAEFEEGMLKCKDLKLNKQKIKQMFNELDVAKNGQLVFENLLDALVHDYLIASDIRLREAFEDLDVNKTDKIPLDSLKKKICKMNRYDNIDVILSIIDDVDLANNGYIDYEEFSKALHPDFNETPNIISIHDEIKTDNLEVDHDNHVSISRSNKNALNE